MKEELPWTTDSFNDEDIDNIKYTDEQIQNMCFVLGELWMYYREQSLEHEDWSQYFAWADLGLPIAYAAGDYLISLESGGEYYVRQAWGVFCYMIDIDPLGQYLSLEDAWNASPFPRVDWNENE